MRFLFFSDIHGHAAGLDALLTALPQLRPDKLICLGDVATIGPQPREVVGRLRELDCHFVMGNHDLALLAPDRAAELQIAPPLLPSLAWSRSQLDGADLAFLASFAPTLRLPLPGGASLLCYHGSPAATTDQILPTTPAGPLTKLLGPKPAAIMAGGHTHLQMLRQHEGIWVVNPGSVGHGFRVAGSPEQPPQLLPWVEFALIDSNAEALHVTLGRLPFDIAAHRLSVQSSGLDELTKAWWLAQYQHVHW